VVDLFGKESVTNRLYRKKKTQMNRILFYME